MNDDSNVTTLRPKPPADGNDEGFDAILADLNLCRQKLHCATIALNDAEDCSFQGDEELESTSAAIRVVEDALDQLRNATNRLDKWHGAHVHTPKKRAKSAPPEVLLARQEDDD